MRFNNINDMDRTKDACRHQSNNRVIMWYKIRELYSKGFNKSQIAFQLGLHRSTVRRYLKMDEDTLTAKLQHRRRYPRILDKYESYVCDVLSRYRFLSASQIHDWMKEQYPDLPVVCGKTVYNFVETVRRKYNLDKEGLSKRVYEKMPDTPYGEYAQMDFGESRMPTYRNDFVKVYFFVMVMSRSRQKFVYFSCTPFTSALAVYAHGVRVIDTVNPIVEGGTGFIPGPFGTGKTVLQHAISKQAEADIVIIAACGERANEVVEIFTEFPELVDPHTGRKLMERTIIIANTSNMPVAAREASVYTAMTISEYYRAMGLKVLLMADSTSRWAQALREMSNRMEELPGPDAFPMDISAIISNFYGRAGYVHLNNGETGSITFIGTVSPAGGNLKEPVTENTKKVARCFYALEQERADRKRYPAVNPIDSYSKYLEYPEFEEYIAKRINGE